MHRRHFLATLGRVAPLALVPSAAVAGTCFNIPEISGEAQEALGFPSSFKPVLLLGQIMWFTPRIYRGQSHPFIYDGTGWVQLDTDSGRRLQKQIIAELNTNLEPAI